MYRKYDSFFDLKTKRILNFFSFFIFPFHKQNWKMKEFFEIHFLIWNQKMNSKILILIFLKLVLNQNRSKKKIFFFLFQFNNQIWKIKGIFWNSFFHFKSKNELRNFEFCFSFFFGNGLHQNLFWFFWEVGSKIELKLLYHWIKLFKTFTVVGWRLKWMS